VRDIYEQGKARLEAEQLEEGTLPQVHRILVMNALNGALEAAPDEVELSELARVAIVTFQAWAEAELGVQTQEVWDVESTAHAPLGELKFTPYPVERERAEWLDQDGDLVGFELAQDKQIYFLVNSKRWGPLGPAPVVRFAYRNKDYSVVDMTDARGFQQHRSIHEDKQTQVKAMFDAARDNMRDLSR